MAAIYSVGLHDMSRHMQPFMSMYPHARVLLECLHPHKVVDAVLGNVINWEFVAENLDGGGIARADQPAVAATAA